MSEQALVENENVTALQPQVEAPASISPLVMMLASGQLKAEDVKVAMELQRQHEEYEAKKAYSSALARFRKIAPSIRKNKQVSFKTNAGYTNYTHAELGYAMTAINPVLGDCDLNLSWRPRQEGNVIYVVSRLSHSLGHFEEIELQGAPDSSGGKNAIQAVSSTISYLERIGGFAILGLASADGDDDGAGGAPATNDGSQKPAPQKEFKPAYTQQQYDDFHKAIEAKDGFALITQTASMEDNAKTGLFNSFEAGKIVSGKETVRKLVAEAHTIIKKAHADLVTRMDADDETGAQEILAETDWSFIKVHADEALTTWIESLETTDE